MQCELLCCSGTVDHRHSTYLPVECAVRPSQEIAHRHVSNGPLLVHGHTAKHHPAKAIFDLNDKLASAGVFLVCQVLSAGLEIIKHILLVAMCSTSMPFQAILPPASADIKLTLLTFMFLMSSGPTGGQQTEYNT